MSWAWIGLMIDCIVVVALCILVFFIAKRFIRYLRLSNKENGCSKQTEEDRRITIHDL